MFLGNGFCVPFDYIKESILKCYSQICAPLARNRAPKMLTGEDTDFIFFSYTSLLSSIFPERLDHDLSGEMSMNRIRVLNVNIKYLHFAASTIFQVLTRTQLKTCTELNFGGRKCS